MRVLHVTSGNLYGGIESMLVTMARERHLCPEMEPLFALCFSGRLEDELEATGVTVRNLGQVRARNLMSVRRARRMLVDIIANERVDLVVCHAAWPQAIFGRAVTSSGRPFVVWQHAPPRMDFWLDRWAHRVRPDLFVCNSRYTARALREGVEAPWVEVVHCPVALDGCADDGEERRARVRAELGTGPDVKVVIQVSRLEPAKGHLLHLNALSQLPDRTDWECWMVGGAQQPAEHDFYAELRRFVADHGLSKRVKFLGQRSDVADLLAAADIHCQPNTQPEPFGITFVEALAAGLPVVTTRMGGAGEIVDVTCGVLVEPDDSATLALALGKLIEDSAERERLGRNGPERAIAVCDPKQQLSIVSRAFALVGRERSAAK